MSKFWCSLVSFMIILERVQCASTSSDVDYFHIKVKEESNNYDPEAFDWRYELSDGREVRQNAYWNELPDGTWFLQVNGFYSYVGPDGVKYSVSYYVDENGYHPTVIVGDVDLTPKPPQHIDPKVLASLLG